MLNVRQHQLDSSQTNDPIVEAIQYQHRLPTFYHSSFVCNIFHRKTCGFVPNSSSTHAAFEQLLFQNPWPSQQVILRLLHLLQQRLLSSTSCIDYPLLLSSSYLSLCLPFSGETNLVLFQRLAEHLSILS